MSASWPSIVLVVVVVVVVDSSGRRTRDAKERIPRAGLHALQDPCPRTQFAYHENRAFI
jgi:hypothetical protein